MKTKRGKLPKKPLILLAASALLLVGSTVGSTRAALTYYSENYGAEVSVSRIGVSLLENKKTVSSRDYTENDTWSETKGTLLSHLNTEAEKIVPGKDYKEELAVKNSGSIDSFVRVILKKSWCDEKGRKDTALSPELIGLELKTENGWAIDGKASTAERTVLYYTKALAAGETTPPLSDAVRISPDIMKKVKEIVTEDENGYKTIRTEYKYDGYRFQIEAEADAVQTHNAGDAVKSAWGVDVDVSEDGNSLSLR